MIHVDSTSDPRELLSRILLSSSQGEVSADGSLYDKYGLTRCYLQQRKRLSLLRASVIDIAERLGRKSCDEFAPELFDFPDLAKPMERSWLSALGIQISTLQCAVECDAENYARMCAGPVEYSYAIQRVSPALSIRIPLPRPMREQDALECIRELQRVRSASYMLRRQGLYSIYCHTDQEPQRIHYRPKLLLGENYLRFAYAVGGGNQIAI